MKLNHLDHIIEKLCQKGCQSLWADIDAMDRGEDLPETQGLSKAEKQHVLQEIKSIMAVYKGRCDL